MPTNSKLLSSALVPTGKRKEDLVEEKIDENGCYQSFIEISQNMFKQLEDLENFKDLKPVS